MIITEINKKIKLSTLFFVPLLKDVLGISIGKSTLEFLLDIGLLETIAKKNVLGKTSLILVFDKEKIENYNIYIEKYKEDRCIVEYFEFLNVIKDIDIYNKTIQITIFIEEFEDLEKILKGKYSTVNERIKQIYLEDSTHINRNNFISWYAYAVVNRNVQLLKLIQEQLDIRDDLGQELHSLIYEEELESKSINYQDLNEYFSKIFIELEPEAKKKMNERKK